MEAMETQAIHVTETKTLSSSLISSNTKKCIDNDEITPELEDQLLNDNMSEDQVLEDEDDAQSEGSIRLRYSDVEADDDENTDKISGASSGPAINNQKKVNSDTVNESSGFEINGSMPVYTNLNHINEIDFTEDDTLSGINFCDNNDDDENGLIPVKDIIDKTITLNQFSQSAYDNSWRLSGKSPRYRHRNYHNFLRLSNFNQLQNNLNIPYDIGENCEPLKNSDNENINLNDKKVYSNNKNKTSLLSSLPPPSPPPAPAPAPLSSSPSPSKFMTKIFPPSSMIDNDDNLIIESKNDKIAEKLDEKLNDEIKNNTSNVNIIEKNNKITDKDSGEGTDESTDSLQFELPKKQINGILDNKLELNNENIDSTEISSVNNDENNEIITNSVKNSDVIENIVNNKNENTEIEAAKTSDTITDESSDSGFVSSTSTSVTGNDEILKDNSDELIKDKIIDNEEPPVLTPEITIEKEEENINNKVDEIIESDNKLKITETNENIDKENSMIIDEEPTTSIVSNDNNDSTKKSEESIVDDNTKLIESMDIVTIDDCSEITIGPITEKIEEEKNNDIDLKINNDNEKLDKTVDDQESIDTSSHEILVINEEQVDSTDESTKQICSKRKRKSVKTIGDTLDPEKENLRLRVKRETAQKAEELIRKDSQMINEDSDSDDFDIINKNDIKLKNSPTSLKRTNENNDIIDNKRLKIDPKIEIKTETYITNRKIKPYVNLRKILLRDSKEKLANMRQEDLEELLIQKIIESITMRDEIGKLREQAKLSERAKELSQQKCASLAKQIKDFEMIINRYAIDREKNPGIYIPPTKINRSVGLQVNFLTDRGVQNLRQVNKLSQQNTSTNNNNNNNKTHNVNNNYSNNNHNNNTNYNHVNINSVNNNINNNNNRLINNSTAQVIVGGNASGNNIINSITPSIHNDDNPNSQLRKGIKIRSPRRGGDVHPQVIANIQNQLPNQMHLINSVTSPIVAPKINDTRISIASTNSSTITPNTMSNSSIIVNGNSPNIQYRQTRNTNTNINNTQNRTNNNGDNLIDLTEEEEKTKILSSPPALTALVTPVTTSTHLPKNQQRQTKMISNSSSHVTIAQPNVRVVTGQGQTTTGIVNGQRLIFMHPGGTPPRQLILTSTASTSRTTVVTPSSSPRSSYINIAPSGTTPITKSSPVRVLPTPNPPVQLVKVNHPAPLPVIPTHAHNPSWKMPPPAPSLKISKVTHGIVLSWNMILSDKCADIASYQLFAYQEISTTPPSSSLWKKVGDVRALPLPMACTLTQFLEGNNYYFAVRAVDCHGRLGEFSLPGNITL